LMSFSSNKFSPTLVSIMIFIAVVLLAVSQLLEPENYKESSPEYCAVNSRACLNECSEDKDCPKVKGVQFKCNSETGPDPDGGYSTWLTCEPPRPS
jgi:hypothetical protein